MVTFRGLRGEQHTIHFAGCVDDLDVDALLADTEQDISADDAASIPKPDEHRIYTHGFTVQVYLMVRDAAAYLRKIGWTEDSPDWIRSKVKYGTRWLARGSTFVTQRGPQLKKAASLTMARINRKHGTKLYSIEFDLRDDGTAFLVLRGVRHAAFRLALTEPAVKGSNSDGLDPRTPRIS
jgi:hypothetical protein